MLPLFSQPSSYLNPGQQWSILCLYSFTLSRMTYKWNHTVCAFWVWLLSVYFRSTYVFFCVNNFLFIADVFHSPAEKYWVVSSFEWSWRKYTFLCCKWRVFLPYGICKDHSNMVTEIILREAHEIKGFIMLTGPRRGGQGPYGRSP